MAGGRAQITVQIVYAQPQRSIVKSLRMTEGALIADALSLVSQDADFSGIDLLNSPVGIFGKSARKDQVLKDGERIEIYRQLVQEPKLARRTRAASVKAPRVPRR
jgi:putative ubiquitin-RnfH superfamily antitoxin RatB of RatAB toxin-antitoxin module